MRYGTSGASPRGGHVIVRLPTTGANAGRINIYSSGGSPNVTVDVAGYYTPAQTTVGFVYDANGNRVTKTAKSTTPTGPATTFVWDYAEGMAMLAATITGGFTTYYSYGPGGLPLAQGNPIGGVYYLHHDQLGSTRWATTATNTVVGAWTYDPYGQITATSGTATATPMLYAGQYRDSETGLYNLRARIYDPATGQFLTRDPLAAATRSAYGYVGGNPVNATDPSGLATSFGDEGQESGWDRNNMHLPGRGERFYIPPKAGRGKPVWDKEKRGWRDNCGNTWVKDESAHGGSHWDVQHPDGSYTNVGENGM